MCTPSYFGIPTENKNRGPPRGTATVGGLSRCRQSVHLGGDAGGGRPNFPTDSLVVPLKSFVVGEPRRLTPRPSRWWWRSSSKSRSGDRYPCRLTSVGPQRVVDSPRHDPRLVLIINVGCHSESGSDRPVFSCRDSGKRTWDSSRTSPGLPVPLGSPLWDGGRGPTGSADSTVGHYRRDDWRGSTGDPTSRDVARRGVRSKGFHVWEGLLEHRTRSSPCAHS